MAVSTLVALIKRSEVMGDRKIFFVREDLTRMREMTCIVVSSDGCRVNIGSVGRVLMDTRRILSPAVFSCFFRK